MIHNLRVTFLAIFLGFCYAQGPTENLIKSLPGAESFFDDLPSMYSGYLDLPNSEKHVFYWFVESENDPANDPLALWTNGGPGCSGFIGLMTEQGPFRPTEDGALQLNPAGWQKAANMLFIEQPVGVGFSYSDNPDDYSMGDWDSARDLYSALKVFLSQYDYLADNDLYLTSESYGGHYLPTTTKYILDHDTGAQNPLNFKGFFLGNPWTDPPTNAVGRIETLYGHGLVPGPVFNDWTEACYPQPIEQPAKCAQASFEVLRNSHYPSQNKYALNYPSCSKTGADAQRHRFLNFHRDALDGAIAGQDDDVAELLAYDPCVDNYAVSYLNREDVQGALHVNQSAGPVEWRECTVKIHYNHTDGATSMLDTYRYILHNPQGTQLKLEVYSGDDDSDCPTLGTMGWIYQLGEAETTAWETWYYNDTTYGEQFAGFYSQWNGGNLTFSTVHGAGHEVPTYKPEAALTLFKRFLSREI